MNEDKEIKELEKEDETSEITDKRSKSRIIRGFKKVHKIVNEPSFFPELKRKSKLKRYFENYLWVIKNKRPSFFYNQFGLDIKNFRNADDFISTAYVKKERAKIHHKGHPLEKTRKTNINTRYSIIADNKNIFYTYVGSMMPNAVPKNNFTFTGSKVIMPFSDEIDTKEAFNNLPDGRYICKPEIGSHGDMVVAITKKGKNIEFSDKKVDIDVLIKNSEEKPFLVQEFIKQHKDVDKLNKESLNTVRIISTRWNQDVHILAAMIRLGAEKDSIVDNADAGGTFVAIDRDTGKLDKYGYFYKKPRTLKHPVTNIVYEGYQLPYWKEILKLIKDLHPIIFGFATIGWDIAISENGPVIVEINWNYSMKGIQTCNGGLKPRWEELKEK